MEFETFSQQVMNEIKNYLPEKYENASVGLNQVIKNNDQVLTGLTIRTDDTNIAPNIYLDGYFRQYQNGIDLNAILKEIADVRIENERSKDFDVSMITNFDKAKSHIVCKLVNAEMNQEYLSDKPFTRIEDLAVIYEVNLGSIETGNMTTPITNSLMAIYGINVQELHDIALQNLSQSKIEFISMREMLKNMMFPNGLSEDDPVNSMFPPEESQMYVLTNSDGLNGAAAILDKSTLEDISDKLGGNFIIIPSSIHETIILPCNDEYNRQNLENIVKEVNAGQVAPNERLSDHVYMYDSIAKEIVLADRMEKRNIEKSMAVGFRKAFSDACNTVKDSINDLISDKMDAFHACEAVQAFLDASFGKDTFVSTTIPPGLLEPDQKNPEVIEGLKKIVKELPQYIEDSKNKTGLEIRGSERKETVIEKQKKDKGMDI